MATTTRFDTLYTTLREVLRDPQDGGTEGSTPRWTLTEKKRAINDAINDAFPTVRVPKVDDTSVTTSASTFIYSVPSSLYRAEDLDEVFIEVSSEPWKKLTDWRVYEESGTLKLYFDQEQDSGKKLRFVFWTKSSELTNDSDTTIVPPNFILARARAYLHYLAAESAAGNDMELHLTRGNAWWQASTVFLQEAGRSGTTTQSQKYPTGSSVW